MIDQFQTPDGRGVYIDLLQIQAITVHPDDYGITLIFLRGQEEPFGVTMPISDVLDKTQSAQAKQ